MSGVRHGDERAAPQRAAAGKRIEVELSRTYFGTADTPVRYVIVTIPPDPAPERGRVTRVAIRPPPFRGR